MVPQRHRGRDGQRLPDAPFQFGLARNIKDGAPSGEKFWTSVMPRFVAPAGEKYAYLPDWMDKAVQNGTMDAVVVPPQPIAIRAGDAIGFLAQDDAPATGGAVQSDWFMHIEVLSNDTNMPAFLNNPGHRTKGTMYLEVQGNQPLYYCEEKGDKKTFTVMDVTTSTDAGKLLRRDDASPFKDDAGITWYKLRPHTWMKQDAVKEIIQHDLKALRFTPLQQEPAKDFQQSLGEQWLGKAFSFIGGDIHPERALESQELSEYYSQIAKVLDANGDGKISATELKLYRTAVLQGLRHNNEEVEMLLRRLIVKHESEWYGKSSHPRWQTLLDTLPKAGQDYAKIWIDNHEWMSQVPALAKDEAVWHFHPVEWISISMNRKKWFDIEAFISIYKIKHPEGFGSYFHNKKVKTTDLSSASEKALRVLLHELKSQYYDFFEEFSSKYLAYMLSTIRIESFQYRRQLYFSPAEEVITYKKAEEDYGSGPTALNRKRAIRNLNDCIGDGYKYRGRGFVQLTWKINYKKFTKVINEDLITFPEKVLEIRTAVKIMLKGMRDGSFRAGHTLERYLGNSNRDYYHARYIINGDVNGTPDKAEQFEDYAIKFERIINETL